MTTAGRPPAGGRARGQTRRPARPAAGTKTAAKPVRAKTAAKTAAKPVRAKPASKQSTGKALTKQARPSKRPADRPAARAPRRPPGRPAGPPRPGDPNGRIRLMAVAAGVVLAVFVGRLVQVQVVQAAPLAEAALDQRAEKVVLPAKRGDILDRTGSVLATTVERRNVTVDQRIVAQYNVQRPDLPLSRTGIPGAAAALAPLLRLSRAQVRHNLTGSRPFAYVAKGIEPAVWQKVHDLHVPGIYDEVTFERRYPGEQVGASVVGFLGQDGTPLAGVERAMHSELRGTPGVLRYERGARGQQIATATTSRTDPVPGRSVELTIDQDLQWKAQQELCAAVTETKAVSGQLVVMNPRTGQVLALAGCPTFDANRPGRARPQDLSNRSLVDVFEPGSTSKVVTAAAALEEGKVTPATRMTVNDTITRGGKVFHDAESHGPERLTFAGVLAKSSNVGTIRAGEKVPAADMYGYMRKFGLGSASGIGLTESRGLLADPKTWSNSQRYTVLFGQGLSVTALQSAEVFATVANDGVRLRPTIVKATAGPDGRPVAAPRPAGSRVISARTAQQLRRMLENVVGDDGTAIRASVPGYRVAGKTGTAQAYDDRCRCYSGYTASFVGMAPADNPRLVVGVYLQKPRNGYFGGAVAAPVFQKVMTYALANQDVEPTGTKAARMPVHWR